jgi:hypothetical protein
MITGLIQTRNGRTPSVGSNCFETEQDIMLCTNQEMVTISGRETAMKERIR